MSKHGAHVYRLAMDLRLLLLSVCSGEKGLEEQEVKAIGGSLGCAVLW
jgi:hypothetical protein